MLRVRLNFKETSEIVAGFSLGFWMVFVMLVFKINLGVGLLPCEISNLFMWGVAVENNLLFDINYFSPLLKKNSKKRAIIQ